MVIHVCRVRSLVKKMILLQATACIFQHLYISDSFGIVCFGASFWIYLLFVLIHPSRAFFHLMCMFWHFVCILEKKRSGSFSVFLHGCFLLHLVSFCDHFCIIILTARMATIPPPHQVLQRVCFSGYDETYFAHTHKVSEPLILLGRTTAPVDTLDKCSPMLILVILDDPYCVRTYHMCFARRSSHLCHGATAATWL